MYRKFLEILKKILYGKDPETVYFVDITTLYKNGNLAAFIPKNVVLKMPSLTERIKAIPYQSLNDDLLWEMWDSIINEMNRRKASKRGENNEK